MIRRSLRSNRSRRWPGPEGQGSLRGRRALGNESGQTMVEYMLLTGIIVLAVTVLFALLKDREFLFKRITQPIFAYIKYSYKYGDKDALGWDEGQPRKHIQISAPNDSQTFRLFLPVER